MKKVLIYFTQFARELGGSEYMPLLFIAELQKNCEVTLALNWSSDVENAAKLCGIPVDMDRLKVVLVKPESNFLRKLDAILPFYRTKQLKKLAKDADICISTVNMFDFGKPAHHFIYFMRMFGDNAFNDFFMHRKPLTGMAMLKRKLRTFLAENILRPMLGIRSTRTILRDQRERIYPTSRYVEETMQAFYGPFNSTVFYPPTIFRFHESETVRDPLRVNCLGRISPDKKIDEIIRIVQGARDTTGLDLSLHIGGLLDESSYSQSLRKTAEKNPWIHLHGAIYREEKEAFLLSGTYAIHAERDEAFGISVTEYLKAGIIALVPDEGGSQEIVDTPELTYHDNDEAIRILVRLLDDPAFREEQKKNCAARAEEFSEEKYLERQSRLLAEIVAGTINPSGKSPAEGKEDSR